MMKRLNCLSEIRRSCAALSIGIALTSCAQEAPKVLGTLEYDRITLPSPAAERIVAIDVKEGQHVAAGAQVMALERTRIAAQTEATQAEAQRQRESLAELQAGTRSEDIVQARAQLASAQAQAKDARAYYARLQPLGAQKLVAAADVDRARAAAGSADANVRAAQAALVELENGARKERLAQARSALRAAEAQVSAQSVNLDKLSVIAPRAGRIDSLPYRLGDQAPIGAPLAVMLVGDAPYARVYVPEPMRANVKPGDRAEVIVDGRTQHYAAHVRTIRNDPSYTPYYALTGKDAARLSYLAEVTLDAAADLPAGLPVRVEFAAVK